MPCVRKLLVPLVFLILTGCGVEETTQSPEFLVEDAEAARARFARLNDPAIQKVEPFKIFDNLYYIGLEWVSCYLLVTDEGLVLIDALYGDFVEHAVDGIRKMGFDPQDLAYILVTHGHFDHVGGAKQLADLSGARVGLTEADWIMTESAPTSGRAAYEPPARDLVLADGDTLDLGDNEIRFYVTPGHTEGVLSMEFTVYDEGTPHKAFVFGGVGLNFSGVHRTWLYLGSVDRVRAVEGVEVSVTNHASMGKVFERAEQLVQRQAGEPHPFVAPQDFQDWLDELQVNAEAKLEEEQAKAE